LNSKTNYKTCQNGNQLTVYSVIFNQDKRLQGCCYQGVSL